MSNGISFTCDSCGREVLGCNIVNGMKFCAKCYQEIFGTSKDCELLDKDKKIADLEAKLAEKDAELEKWSTQYARAYVNRQNDLIAKNNQLKQQLEDKEKEQNQKAVEQLEKVKELCIEKFNWWKNSEWEGDIYDKADVSNAYFDIEVNIEEKIKQLKGE